MNVHTNKQNRARIYVTVRRIYLRLLHSDGPYNRIIRSYCSIRPRTDGIFYSFGSPCFYSNLIMYLFFNIVTRVVVESEMSKNVVIVSQFIGLAYKFSADNSFDKDECTLMTLNTTARQLQPVRAVLQAS